MPETTSIMGFPADAVMLVSDCDPVFLRLKSNPGFNGGSSSHMLLSMGDFNACPLNCVERGRNCGYICSLFTSHRLALKQTRVDNDFAVITSLCYDQVE